jgi:hypothetical protein
MKCPSCGTDNREGARFCRQCAGVLPAGPPEVGAVCPNCGARVSSGTKFCLACGASLDKVRPVARPLHPAAPPTRPAQSAPQSPPLWSAPAPQRVPPPPPQPVAPPPYAAPLPKPKRGGKGCVWALIAGGVLGVLLLIGLIVLIFLWFYFMPR